MGPATEDREPLSPALHSPVSHKLIEELIQWREELALGGAELELAVGQTVSKRGTRRGESMILLLRNDGTKVIIRAGSLFLGKR